MPIDLDKMKKERAERNSGNEIWDAPEGDHKIYVCAFPRPTDDIPYVEAKMHYGLGPKARASHMCLEPSYNKLLLNDDFLEHVAALKKSVAGGCPTCEMIDRGESVSGNPDQSGKSQSRWLWIVSPRATRGDARAQFQPWPKDEVVGLFGGFRVWDALMDQFGSSGDITDMDAAMFPRLIRTGKKMETKWEVQADVETIRKPVKLAKPFRDLIASEVRIGGKFDPLVILAGMMRERDDILKIHSEATEAKSEYEDKPPEAGTEGYKPPGKGGKVAAAAPSKPAAASGTKAVAPKPSAKPAANAGAAAANAKLKALIAAGNEVPGCFQVDPDPDADICIKCPFQELCFDHCGVARPAPTPDTPDEPTPNEIEMAADDVMTVEACQSGVKYTVDGNIGTYKGPAKGAYYFTGDDGKPFKVQPGAVVEPVADEVPEETDDEAAKMAELEKELAARKKSKAAAKK